MGIWKGGGWQGGRGGITWSSYFRRRCLGGRGGERWPLRGREGDGRGSSFGGRIVSEWESCRFWMNGVCWIGRMGGKGVRHVDGGVIGAR